MRNTEIRPNAAMITKEQIEQFLMDQAELIKRCKSTYSQPGSIKHLLFGSEPSEQSLLIKMGKVGERMIQKIIVETEGLELLKCGVQCIDPVTGKNKDLDLIWADHDRKTIYYREAKGNIQLDSEKITATIDKILEILSMYIVPKYPDYTIDIGVFNWSVYNREPLTKGLIQIKKCVTKGIKVDHPKELFDILKFQWTEEDYLSFFRKIGKFFRNN